MFYVMILIVEFVIASIFYLWVLSVGCSTRVASAILEINDTTMKWLTSIVHIHK